MLSRAFSFSRSFFEHCVLFSRCRRLLSVACMIFHSLLQNYAEYKETLAASATKRRDELDDVLWGKLLEKMSENEKSATNLQAAANLGSLPAFPNSPKAAEKIAVAALAAEKGDPDQFKGQLLKDGTFGELIRDDEQGFKSETLLLNSWQPESKSGDKPRSCHMQTMKFKCKDGKDGENHEGDVKVYWNKMTPPG